MSDGNCARVRDALQDLMISRDGPLTRELLFAPAKFGLGKLPVKSRPDATTTTVCGYCSTGCGLSLHLKNGEAIGLSPAVDYPVNLGMACPKGWESLRVLESDDRATSPLLKDSSGKQQPVDWPTAMDAFVNRFKAIQEKYGPESVAFLGTGQITTEELAFLGALAKFGMGMLHGDGNTRQCMATAVVAYKQSFGFDAPPYAYKDFELSDVIVLIGSNLCIAHPILWERVCLNRNSPKIIVVDPRFTETAMAAGEHVALNPKSDLTFFYGLAKLLIDNDWIDRAYIERCTSGFEEFVSHLSDFTLERVEQVCGVSPEQMRRLAETIHNGKRVSFWWTMGVNQSYEGVRAAQSIINISLMTGNIGKPGTGANSVTGQCNAMGSRLFSNTTNLLGGRDFADPSDRAEVAFILGIPEATIPTQASWAYDQILEGVLSNKIKGLWIVATNGAHSWINQHGFQDVLSRLDFLVVQDMYRSTETAKMADLVLPAAGWGEKEGTFINSERRIAVVKKAKVAPGQALSDFNIFRLISRHWGVSRLFEDWTSPEQVFQKLKQLSAGQPCDFSGIRDYCHLDEQGGIQWPFTSRDAEAGAPAPERRLFEDGRYFHSDGRAKFLFEMPRSMPEKPNDEYPFLLLTGRGSASQWHTQTRTAKSPVLRKLYPAEAYVEINPADARRMKISPNSKVTVASRRGRLTAHAVLTNAVRTGQAFIPMHYATTNQLTDAVFDPYSRQPSYKACAVRLEPT